MKATIVVENRTGAGGAIGAAEAAGAAPDGYTLLFVASPFTTVAAAAKNPGYDPVRQFAPVAPIAAGPLAFVVGNDVPAGTMREFIELAKARAGQAQLRLRGCGQRQPSGARTDERARRHRRRARAVSRHRRRDEGSAGRRDPGDDGVDPGHAAARRRQARQGAGGDRRQADPAAARRAELAGRRRPQRQRDQLLGHRRAGRHAARRSSRGSTPTCRKCWRNRTCASDWNAKARS